MNKWQPMSTAPKDGTIVLVCETPNGEQWNVLPAAFVKHVGIEDWWGVWPRKDDITGDHYWYSVALLPICWQPLPKPERLTKLRRREGQLLRYKYGEDVRKEPKHAG